MTLPYSLRFTIVVLAYNSEQWIETCIQSALAQQWPNFEVVCVDAGSTDRTGLILDGNPDPRLRVLHRPVGTRTYVPENMLLAATEATGDVMVVLDGDDWLEHNQVLRRVAVEYGQGAWLTYGSHRYSNGKIPTVYRQYPASVIRLGGYRDGPGFYASHLRTFCKDLLMRVEPQDLRLADGTWPDMAGDIFLMFPMLEMAAERQAFIPEILYCYNLGNPLSDHNLNAGRQVQLAEYARTLRKYSRLEAL